MAPGTDKISGKRATPLRLLDKDGWRDVCLKVKRRMTEEELDIRNRGTRNDAHSFHH